MGEELQVPNGGKAATRARKQAKRVGRGSPRLRFCIAGR